MTFVRTDIMNPYNREVLSTESYNTLIDFLLDQFPEGFGKPTDVSVNGQMIEVDDYDIELHDNDVIVLLDRTALPVGIVGSWFLTALANLAISVTLTYVANKLFAPDSPSEQAQPSSVYNINSGQNIARLGSPIPIIYGKVRMYPSMIVQPYYKFENDIEYLYHILCVGHGTCTTDEVLIANDSITNTNDLQWKLLYKDSFYNIPLKAYGVHLTSTLSNPINMELKIDNGESEKYTITKDAQFVEFDYMYPNGLILYEGDGEDTSARTSFTVRLYVQVDGVYSEFYSESFYMNMRELNPIQRTKRIDISQYDVPVYISFQKTLGVASNMNVTNTFVKRVKAIYPNEDFTNTYGDITLLAVKIKATDAVSSQGQVKVNGYFERTDVGNTMAEVLTDIYTNTTYGGALNAADLDFPATPETVDCVYEESMTIFDAMRKPAIAQRYSLYLAGMDVILKKDAPNPITSAMYNELNIIRNTLKVQYLFKEENPSYDGFQCNYIDGDGWTVKSEIYPSYSLKPKVVDLFGVVDWHYFPPTGDVLTELGHVNPVGNSLQGVAVRNNVAFVVSPNNNSVSAIDISDPTTPTVLDTHVGPTMSSPYGIAIDGSIAYVVCYSSDNIIAIDISDPSNMVEISSLQHYTYLNFATNLTISGTMAYVVCAGTYDIVEVDISDPSTMVLGRRLALGTSSLSSDVVIDNGIAYVIGANSNSIVSIDLSSFTVLQTLSDGNFSRCTSAAIKGTVLFITSEWADRISSVDISDPSNMSIISTLLGVDTPTTIEILGDTAYIATTSYGSIALSIDISDPSNMVLKDNAIVGSQPFDLSRGNALAISGSTLVVTTLDGQTLYTVDISDPNGVFTIAPGMAKYLYKQDDSRRKIVTFQTDIQGLVPQFLDKIMVSHNALQWGEAGEVISRALDSLVLSDALEDLTAGKTIVFRDIDGSVSIPYSITITDATHITVVGMPSWVAENTFYTIQAADTAKEFTVIAVKPGDDTVQIDCVNYDETIYN